MCYTVKLPELRWKCPEEGRAALGQDGDEEEEASGKLCLIGGGGGGCDGGAVLNGSSAGKAGKTTKKRISCSSIISPLGGKTKSRLKLFQHVTDHKYS